VKVIKAIYNFIVGDMIILVGVVIAVLVLAIINNVSALSPLRGATGFLLVAAVLITLTATLYREAMGKR
jgi:hypothetical protein